MRRGSTLVVMESCGKGNINATSLSAVTAAAKMAGGGGGGGGDKIVAFLVGSASKKAAESALKVKGVSSAMYCDHPSLDHPVAETLSAVIEDLQKAHNFSAIVAASSSLSKATLPRLSARLDSQMMSDVIAIEPDGVFVRPIYAGNALAKIKCSDPVKVVTFRATNFDKAEMTNDATGSISEFKPTSLPASPLTSWVSDELASTDRVELGSAKIVVSGGRGVGSSENFAIINKLADKLKAGVGASRAAVDAGFCSNDMQIGQTGKVVAPQLYVAVGISGAIQHLAGMKDSKVIVAINKDAEAPIFQVADYGLVADLFSAVPEMTGKL